MLTATAADIKKHNSCLHGLPPTIYWKELAKAQSQIPEPQNLDNLLTEIVDWNQRDGPPTTPIEVKEEIENLSPVINKEPQT